MIVMNRSLHVLLISGSLRERSTNAAVLRTAAELAGDGVTTTLYGGMAELPHFNPDDDREGEPVDTSLWRTSERRSPRLMRCCCAPPNMPARYPAR
jgi:NAD(P)H-dependent FMN reductase